MLKRVQEVVNSECGLVVDLEAVYAVLRLSHLDSTDVVSYLDDRDTQVRLGVVIQYYILLGIAG